MDIIHVLGTRAVGSRLKRITEYLAAEVSAVYNAFEIESEPNWLPIFVAVKNSSAVTIKDVSEMTGLSHSAISQAVKHMKESGLLETYENDEDKRQKRLQITEKGEGVLKKLSPVCDLLKLELEKRFKDTGYDVLEVIAKLEAEIKRDSLSASVIKRYQEMTKLEYKPIDEKRNNYLEQNLQQGLDPAVGIAITYLSGTKELSVYLSSIPSSVSITPHYHQHGSEIYTVLSGEGTVKLGRYNDAQIYWEKEMPIKAGDCFTVEEKVVHKLINTGTEDIKVLFNCAETHLGEDRIICEE